MAVQQDPYVALPSLYGAPAYSRPPRPPVEIERPLSPDDLPLTTEQTDEERRIADALLASGRLHAVGADAGYRLPGGRDPGYQVAGVHASGPVSGLFPRRLSLRVLADRIRTRG